MTGCYGTHPEDRYFQAQMVKHLHEQFSPEERIKSLYGTALENLTGCHTLGSGSFVSTYSNLQEILTDVRDEKEFCVLGAAVRDSDVHLAGELIIAIVTKQLMKQAKSDYEDGL